MPVLMLRSAACFLACVFSFFIACFYEIPAGRHTSLRLRCVMSAALMQRAEPPALRCHAQSLRAATRNLSGLAEVAGHSTACCFVLWWGSSLPRHARCSVGNGTRG